MFPRIYTIPLSCTQKSWLFVYCCSMRTFISIFALPAVILLFCCPGAKSQVASSSQPLPRDDAHGVFGPHIAVGSVNGVRLGLRYFPAASVALEASGGYLQVTLLRENERKEYTNGVSVTLGGSWFTHPRDVISPTISLLGVYVASTKLPDGFSQTRFAVVTSLGSEYYFHRGFSVFFRFGPAFQFTNELNKTRFETTTQFDGGVSLLF